MNEKSLEKIQAAANFLSQFHHALPREIQEFVRPHLAQPYQSALKILDCFVTEQPITVDDIVKRTNLSKPTVRQLLRTLQQSGIVDASHTVKTWQKMQGEMQASDQEHCEVSDDQDQSFLYEASSSHQNQPLLYETASSM